MNAMFKLALVALCTSLGAAQARADLPAPEHAITLEPLGVVFARTIGLEYERSLGKLGLFGGLSVTIGDLSLDARSGAYLGVGLTLGARFYPWTHAPAGAFVSPFGAVSWASADSRADADTHSTEGWSWAMGGLAGYTWIFGSSFELSTGLGLTYMQHVWARQPEGARVLPAIRLAVGAVF